jgi:hypothetical protein
MGACYWQRRASDQVIASPESHAFIGSRLRDARQSVRRLSPLQLAFFRDALVAFGWAFDSILKSAILFRQPLLNL